MQIRFIYTRLPKPRGRAPFRLQFTLCMEEVGGDLAVSPLGKVQVPLDPIDADKWGNWLNRVPYPYPLHVKDGCLVLGIPFRAMQGVRFSADTAAERERFIAALHALVAALRARWIEWWREHPPRRGDRTANVFAVRLPSPAEMYWQAEAERLSTGQGRRYALDEPSPGSPEAV